MTERFDDGGRLRLLPLFGGLMVVLAWLGLWWGSGTPGGIAANWIGSFPGGAELFQVGSVAAMAAGIGGVVLALSHMLGRQRKMAAELALREIELAETRDRLRRHVADLERVADIAARDLQEPLRRMVAYAQLLESHQRGTENEEARLYLNHVVDGARRMKALVSGLGAFVSVDSAPPDQSGPVAVADAVAVARKRLADVLGPAGAAMVVDPLPEVKASHASLVEIFVQLIDNAIRFRSLDRRPVVHVSATTETGRVVFQVRDNGLGIDPNRAAKMFEIFFRPHGADLMTHAGIGMGLAVVRRLVERMGGEIWVESEPGKGSCFSFTLPSEPPPGGTDQEVKAA